jgi:hypothetical protein
MATKCRQDSFDFETVEGRPHRHLYDVIKVFWELGVSFEEIAALGMCQ